MLTPTKWNPHDHEYRLSEESMLDWKGEMMEKKKPQRQVLLSSVKEDVAMAASLSIGDVEACVIDANLEKRHDESFQDVRPLYPEIPRGCDEVSSVFAGIDPCLNDEVLYQRLAARAELGDFMMAVGATTAMSGSYLDVDEVVVETVDDDDSPDYEMEEAEGSDAESSEEHDDYEPEAGDDSWINDLIERATAGEFDFDDIMASATNARRSQGVDAEHLSKIWRISVEEATRILETTMQDKVHNM
jgi:hypothetical protein